MKKKLTLSKETLMRLNESGLFKVAGGTLATCDTAGFTFCYPTRDECGYTYNSQCRNSDISYCVCEQ